MDKIIINGHEAVDLGLSVKWATCNVGASSPEEFGDYFAWGETETKAVFSKCNHRFYDPTPYSFALDPTPIGLYYRKGYYRKRYKDGGGYIIYTISGSKDYDAARTQWGASWRMPLHSEFKY